MDGNIRGSWLSGRDDESISDHAESSWSALASLPQGGGGSFKTFGVSETWLIGRHCPHGYTTPPPHHSSTSKLAPIAKVEKTNLEGGAYLKYIFMTWDSYNSQPFVSFYTLSHNLSHKV